MGYQDSRGGSRKINVVTESVGRICKHTGFYTRGQVKKCELIIRKLDEDAQIEVLEAVKEGAITFHQLVDADRAGKLGGRRLLTILMLRAPLWKTVDTMLTSMGKGPETRRRYTTSLRKLREMKPILVRPGAGSAETLGDGARVGQLARVDWKALRQDQRWQSAADWNHLRRAVGAFLTAYLGDARHGFRRKVMKRIELRREKARVPENALAERFWEIVAAVPEHARPCYVTLAASGLRKGEYLRCGKEHLRGATCEIDLAWLNAAGNAPGSKTEDSADRIAVAEALWPWVEQGIPSPLQERWMGIYWRRACVAVGIARDVGTGRFKRVRVPRATSGPYRKDEQPEIREVEITRYVGPRLHDLRHLFGQLADAMGATTEMVQVALRHTNPRQSSDYKRRQAQKEVAELVGAALLQRRVG